MFVYEKGNSLNLTFKGSIPVDNPEVVIKGYEDGATLTVNGTVFGQGSKEFEGKAKTFVYQKDNKLMITFRGIAGMSDPEVTIDDLGNDNYKVVVDLVDGETTTTLVIKEDKVEIITEADTEDTEDTETEEPVVEPEVPTEPVVVDETEEEVTEE